MRSLPLPDGTVLNFPDGTPDIVIENTRKKILAESQAPQDQAPTDGGVFANSFGKKSVGNAIDTILSGPNRILNAVTVGASELGDKPVKSMDDPRLFKDITLGTDALNAMGFNRPDLEPQNDRQRVIDAMGQGAATGFFTGGASIPGMLTGGAAGLTGGLAAQKTKEVTGSDMAALLAGALAGGGTIRGIQELPVAASSMATKANQAFNTKVNEPFQQAVINKVTPSFEKIAPVVEKTIETVSQPHNAPEIPAGNFLLEKIGAERLPGVISALENWKAPLEGFRQNAGEITGDPFLSQATRKLARDPEYAGDFSDLRQSQFDKRIGTIKNMTMTPEQMARSEAHVTSVTSPKYQKLQEMTFQADDDLMKILAGIKKSTLNEAARKTRAYQKETSSGKYVPERTTSTGILSPDGEMQVTNTPAQFPEYTGAELKNIQKVLAEESRTHTDYPMIRGQLNEWINARSDNALSNADSVFKSLMAPQNRSQYAEALLDKLEPALNKWGGEGEKAQAFAKALNDAQVAKKVTGTPIPKEQFMRPEDLNKLDAIAKTYADHDTFMRRGNEIGGSPTAPLLDMGTMLGSLGLPEWAAPAAGAMSHGKLARMGGAMLKPLFETGNQNIQKQIAQALLDPQGKLLPMLKEAQLRQGVKP